MRARRTDAAPGEERLPAPVTAALADLAAAVERAASDLALAEEPARFLVVLEDAAGRPQTPPIAARDEPGQTPLGPSGAASTSPPPSPAAVLERRTHAGPPRTLTGLAAAIRSRQVSPVDLTEACLDRIARLNPVLRAFLTVDAEGARATARVREAEAKADRFRGPLHGLPLGYKDLFAVHGLPASCGTAAAHYFLAETDATAVARLTAAGSVTLGKLNMSELALGPFGDNAHHGDVQNPWRSGHAAGGSSSGSGAAVAAGLAPAALGTDTGGSIRLPAAACGIVGLKPTYGRVSRAGVMPLSWSLDHVGPMTRTVRDAAALLALLAGADPRDATTSARAVPDYGTALDRPVAGLRAGVPANYFWDDLDPEVAALVRGAVEGIRRLGVVVREVVVPDPRLTADLANVIARSESAAIHARVVREAPHALQPAVRARLEVGLHVPAHDYLQATRLRARVARVFVEEALGDVDVLLTPTIPEAVAAGADAV